MTREEAIQVLKMVEAYGLADEAKRMAIEALKRETHDGCDGCMYEHYEELTELCYSCKQNYMDNYKPMPKHDRDWIVGCIKHDGFIKTDRGDKANQIILEALEADTVEVVRCKDCKWATEARMKSIEGDVIVLKTCPSRTEVIEDDDFCSYGERSDE